jgi:hypothetical protein
LSKWVDDRLEAKEDFCKVAAGEIRMISMEVCWLKQASRNSLLEGGDCRSRRKRT